MSIITTIEGDELIIRDDRGRFLNAVGLSEFVLDDADEGVYIRNYEFQDRMTDDVYVEVSDLVDRIQVSYIEMTTQELQPCEEDIGRKIGGEAAVFRTACWFKKNISTKFSRDDFIRGVKGRPESSAIVKDGKLVISGPEFGSVTLRIEDIARGLVSSDDRFLYRPGDGTWAELEINPAADLEEVSMDGRIYSVEYVLSGELLCVGGVLPEEAISDLERLWTIRLGKGGKFMLKRRYDEEPAEAEIRPADPKDYERLEEGETFVPDQAKFSLRFNFADGTSEEVVVSSIVLDDGRILRADHVIMGNGAYYIEVARPARPLLQEMVERR